MLRSPYYLRDRPGKHDGPPSDVLSHLKPRTYLGALDEGGKVGVQSRGMTESSVMRSCLVSAGSRSSSCGLYQDWSFVCLFRGRGPQNPLANLAGSTHHLIVFRLASQPARRAARQADAEHQHCAESASLDEPQRRFGAASDPSERERSTKSVPFTRSSDFNRSATASGSNSRVLPVGMESPLLEQDGFRVSFFRLRLTRT